MPTFDEAAARWKIETRMEAYARMGTFYFTGKPCKYGHYDQRSVASGVCVSCNRSNASKYRTVTKQGYKRFEIICHPADESAIKDYVAAVNAQRDVQQQNAATADIHAIHKTMLSGLAAVPGFKAPPFHLKPCDYPRTPCTCGA